MEDSSLMLVGVFSITFVILVIYQLKIAGYVSCPSPITNQITARSPNSQTDFHERAADEPEDAQESRTYPLLVNSNMVNDSEAEDLANVSADSYYLLPLLPKDCLNHFVVHTFRHA